MRTSVLDHLDAIPSEAVKLGRIVLDAKQPHHDFIDPSKTSSEAHIKCEIQDFQHFQNAFQSASMKARLSHFLSSSNSNEKGQNKDLTAEKVEIHKLANSGKWFRDACQDSNVREWIETALDEGSDIYLIIGFCVLCDSRYDLVRGGDKTLTVSAQIPVSSAVGIGGGQLLDVSASGALQRQYEERMVALFLGQNVCAVQYRQLKFKWFSSRNVDTGFLEHGHRWELRGAFRGESDDDDEDVLEADLKGDSEEEEEEEEEEQ